MNELTIISWRQIPAQVIARKGREAAVRRELSPRFQAAIDRAAMQAGLFGSDDYLNEWVRSSTPCGDDLEAEADAAVARLEAEYGNDVLNELANNEGNR